MPFYTKHTHTHTDKHMYGKRRVAKIVFACKLPNVRRNLRVRVGRERGQTDGGRVSVLSLKK